MGFNSGFKGLNNIHGVSSVTSQAMWQTQTASPLPSTLFSASTVGIVFRYRLRHGSTACLRLSNIRDLWPAGTVQRVLSGT